MLTKIERQSVLFGRFLYFFATYTVTIKYFLPVAWALAKRMPPTSFIFFWDAWWLLHLAVGFGLDRRKKGVWFWAFLLAVVEIIIVTAKFMFYFRGPNLDFWHLNWFVNKTLLLAYFLVLVLWLLKKETRSLL